MAARRSGTCVQVQKNLYGIVGFAKALEMATQNFEQDSTYINDLKLYMKEQMQQHIKGVVFNGDPLGNSLYTSSECKLSKNRKERDDPFNLDINNICTSGGSACTSGADAGSHVIRAINNNPNQVTVRFSFSRHNTKEEIDTVIEKLNYIL